MTRKEAEDLTEVVTKTQNRLRGRLLSLVESWGLDDERTTAMKHIVKGTTYDNEYDLKQTIYRMSIEDASVPSDVALH